MTNDLKNVKAGDEVILYCGRFGAYSRTIEKVIKITPKGFIKVGNFLYYADGRERGGSLWNSTYIKALTKEEADLIKKENYCRKVLNYLHDLRQIDYDKAVKVMWVLKGDNV